MDGIKINLLDDVPALDFSSAIHGFDADVQNAMVNIATRVGSDRLFKDRGTKLMVDAVQGRMVNLTWANHQANFAALSTLLFSQKTDVSQNTTGLQSLSLKAGVYNINRLSFQIQAKSVKGETRGINGSL